MSRPTTQGVSTMEHSTPAEYESPTLMVLGSLYELTLGCDKTLGTSDGFTFQGQAIVCSSTT
ncbi:MAG: hypothetical protein ACRDOS_00135 [Gaiellaceae bacterium]